MASGIFAVLDDIATLMDDVAMASKIATQKTAGILGDDLAVNAEKATGFVASREIPVLLAITKGSFINKLIIIPIALALNYFFPIVIKYILIAGGCYLAYEGVEKVVEYLFHRPKKGNASDNSIKPDDEISEKQKVKSAITTDFILSIEIVIIALGTVLGKELVVQAITVTVVAFAATIGVYGLVAMIVRMDDAGYFLIRHSKANSWKSKMGNILVKALPYVIKMLAVVGTIALLVVSGGIFVHYIDYIHHLWPNFPNILKELTFGTGIGLVMVLILSGAKWLGKKLKKATA